MAPSNLFEKISNIELVLSFLVECRQLNLMFVFWDEKKPASRLVILCRTWCESL